MRPEKRGGLAAEVQVRACGSGGSCKTKCLAKNELNLSNGFPIPRIGLKLNLEQADSDD